MFKRIKSIKTTGRKWTDRSQLLNLCVQPWLCHITVRIIKSYELYVQYLDRPDSLLPLFIHFILAQTCFFWYRSYILGWEVFVIQYCVAVLLLFLSTLQRLLLAESLSARVFFCQSVSMANLCPSVLFRLLCVSLCCPQSCFFISSFFSLLYSPIL